MRFCLIGHAYVAAANRGKLALMAAQPDVEVHLVCPERWPEPEFGVRVAEPTGDGYTVHIVPARNAGNVRRAVFDRRSLARALEAIRPDVVQIEQEPASRMAFQCMRLAVRRKVPAVLFAWDNLSGRNRFPLDWIAAYNLRRAAHVLAGNEAARRLAELRGASGKCGVLPQIGLDEGYGTDVDAGDVRARLGLSGFVVGFVARLVARKGPADLLAAFARLGEGSTLLIVGDGPEREPLLRRAEQLGVADRVRLVGSVPHEQVAEYLAAMDCLVLPSRTTPGWAEQFGHVLIEAMAMGVPVLGSDSGAIPEVIGDAGIVVPEGDACGLGEAIERLRNDPALRADLAARGRERALSRFTNRAIAEHTLAVARRVRGR